MAGGKGVLRSVHRGDHVGEAPGDGVGPLLGGRLDHHAHELLGARRAQQRGETVEVKDATLPTAGTNAEIQKWQSRQRVTQFLVPALAGANIVCNSWLVQSYRAGATAKGVLRRLLPD